jgi:uncharacterized protein
MNIMEQIERICISTNVKCNLGCTYCYFFNPEHHMLEDKSLSEEEIYEILAKIYEYSLLTTVTKKIKVLFVGSGEPLISWKQIKGALEKYYLNIYTDKIKFYMVTNGVLVTQQIAEELKALNVFPSVSIDGFKEINDKSRPFLGGKGSFDKAVRGYKLLQEAGFDVAVNTVMTWDVIENLDRYWEFVKEYNVNKVIFDRLVDVPSHVKEVPVEVFYGALYSAFKKKDEHGLHAVEIGNIESFRRAFEGNPDKSCTLFGSTCGAGTNFIIYLLRDAYPCGRMFDNETWKLGEINTPIEEIQFNMFQKIEERPTKCTSCSVKSSCIKDCLIEEQDPSYECISRVDFIRNLRTDLGYANT